MLDYTFAKIEEVIVHLVGNKLRDEGIRFSKDTSKYLESDLQDVLLQYYLTSLVDEKSIYQFDHETDVNLNEIYVYAKDIFNNRDVFIEQSINAAKHLYEKSTHPRIKNRELYIVYFSGVKFDDIITDAVGIFISENKDTFLTVTAGKDAITVDFERGVNIEKLEKGCLVVNQDSSNGYKILMIDSGGKSKSDAQYWKDEFLKVKPKDDEHFNTMAYLKICNNFGKEVYSGEEEASKIDHIRFNKETIKYFSENEEFVVDKFSEEVIQDPNLIAKFKTYKEESETSLGIEMKSDFKIATELTPKLKRIFSDVIKLDNGIQIKVTGEIENYHENKTIERGFDEETGYQYYKIFFKHEK